MPSPRPTITLIGRPNVGKSTFYNRLIGKKIAIVDDMPGVTRDWKEGNARLAGLEFTIIDTPGIEGLFAEGLSSRLRQQAETAIGKADSIWFMIDGKTGVTPLDEQFAAWLRTLKKPVVLLMNKSETKKSEANSFEAYQLGFGAPLMISAEHGLGLEDIVTQALAPLFPEKTDEPTEQQEDLRHFTPTEDKKHAPLSIALIGRPNAGKSTLFNAIIGEERTLTGPEAGLTRDAISVPFHYNGETLKLVDTAGMRRKANVTEKVEDMAVKETLHALRFAPVVVLVIDATLGFEKQDLLIAGLVEQEGRCLIVAANKWDLVEKKGEKMAELKRRLSFNTVAMQQTPIIPLAAIKQRNYADLLDACLMAYDLWNTRISTAKLNTWLERVLAQHPPPLVQGRRFKVRYMTQIKSRPPTFALFSTSSQGSLPEDYLRYLENDLRESFALPAIPLRFLVRKGDNPYAEKK